MDAVPLRHPLDDLAPGDRAGRLVLGDLGDAPGVAFLARERRRDERVDEALDLVERMLAGADPPNTMPRAATPASSSRTTARAALMQKLG
jgi:hypothetical protein